MSPVTISPLNVPDTAVTMLGAPGAPAVNVRLVGPRLVGTAGSVSEILYSVANFDNGAEFEVNTEEVTL